MVGEMAADDDEITLKQSNRPTFIMLSGLPGSGKSAWLQREFLPYMIEAGVYTEVLSTDEIVNFIAIGTSKTYSDVFKDVISEATQIVNARISLSTLLGLNIVLDQTNLTMKSRQMKLNLIRNKERYNKIAIVFSEPDEVLEKRNEARAKTGKIIDDEVFKGMKARQEPVTILDDVDEILTPDEFKLKYMPKIIKETV